MAERNRPSGGPDDTDGGFLQRWSRRKAEARSAATVALEQPSGPADSVPASGQRPPEPDAAAPAPIDPEDLPDIETLDASSDFTAFMRPGVPEHLRTLALRKLWRSDPIFSKLDGLVEYGEDYSIATWPKDAIKTAYKVGRGFLEEISEGAGGPEQAPQADEPGDQPAAEPARLAGTPAESSREPDPPRRRIAKRRSESEQSS
jgi:Protein of unknown function (DUF3306)